MARVHHKAYSYKKGKHVIHVPAHYEHHKKKA